MSLYNLVGVCLLVTLLVICVAVIRLESAHREVVRRRQEAYREDVQTKRIVAAMRAIGAEQSAALSVQAMNACVDLLAEAQASSPELSAFRSNVVDITLASGASTNGAHTANACPSRRSD